MRRYKPADFAEIAKWQLNRQRTPVPSKYLPELGFIVPDVAVGFALTNGTPLAHIEYFISNPNAPKEHRTQGMQAIAQKLIEELKAQGVEVIRIDSQVPSICRIAEDLGFGELMSNNYILSLS